jgi:hypothetical protein
MQTDLVLDALEQALYAPQVGEGLIHHGDQGCARCLTKRKDDARRALSLLTLLGGDIGLLPASKSAAAVGSRTERL